MRSFGSSPKPVKRTGKRKCYNITCGGFNSSNPNHCDGSDSDVKICEKRMKKQEMLTHYHDKLDYVKSLK